MAAQVLSIDREFRYIVMWFNEWSELQREDFIPVLVEYLISKSNSDVYMNGLVNSVNNLEVSSNKPMSLFQCRIKLFREWNCKWPSDFKQKLKEKIYEIDAKIGEKVDNEIKAYNDIHSNGNSTVRYEPVKVVNGDSVTATIVDVDDDIVSAAVAIVNETEEAIMSDNRLVALLNNEMSVDDDDDDNGNDCNDDGDKGNDKTAANEEEKEESIAHSIEPAGQVQAQQEDDDDDDTVNDISAQNVPNDAAEILLIV